MMTELERFPHNWETLMWNQEMLLKKYSVTANVKPAQTKC